VAPGDLVVEIGAGDGRLTEALARSAQAVEAIELDPALASRLRLRFATSPQVVVIEGDALAAPLPQGPFRAVGNLPFYETTAILRRLLDEPARGFLRADVIVQWDLACKRARCWPSTLLGVLWGVEHELAVVRRLPAACFRPRPAVDAAVLRIVRRPVPLVPPAELARFRALVETGFRSRAPTLRRALAPLVRSSDFRRAARELGVGPAATARELDLHQWLALHRAVRPLR
jgi:23S rRNA (adenine-N6)-dimethyltransferase